jgi:hypothetical protein
LAGKFLHQIITAPSCLLNLNEAIRYELSSGLFVAVLFCLQFTPSTSLIRPPVVAPSIHVAPIGARSRGAGLPGVLGIPNIVNPPPIVVHLYDDDEGVQPSSSQSKPVKFNKNAERNTNTSQKAMEKEMRDDGLNKQIGEESKGDQIEQVLTQSCDV